MAQNVYIVTVNGNFWCAFSSWRLAYQGMLYYVMNLGKFALDETLPASVDDEYHWKDIETGEMLETDIEEGILDQKDALPRDRYAVRRETV